MRNLKAVNPLKDQVGLTRVRRKFLFLPKTFTDGIVKETRWLCFAPVVEQVCIYREYIDAYYIGDGYAWFEIGFLDSHVRAE